MTSIEAAARALCRQEGHPENTKFEGRPMWESYRDQAAAVLAAVNYEPLREIAQRIIEWRETGARGPDWRGLEKLKLDARFAIGNW